MINLKPIQVDMYLSGGDQEIELDIETNFQEYDLLNDVVINVTEYDVPNYEGDYIVTPMVHSEVVLETKDKRCTDDITVLKVPKSETSNEFGTTFYIGEI